MTASILYTSTATLLLVSDQRKKKQLLLSISTTTILDYILAKGPARSQSSPRQQQGYAAGARRRARPICVRARGKSDHFSLASHGMDACEFILYRE